jgi:transposase-like protein
MKRPKINETTTKTKESYKAEFKENAVKRATESNNIAQTARELGIKENTLYNWVYKYSRTSETPKVTRSDEHLYDELKLRTAYVGLRNETQHSQAFATYQELTAFLSVA